MLTLAILSVVVAKGQQHDFSVFKDSRLLWQRTKPIIKHYQNSVFSLNISTADAKFSGLLRMFIGASTRITP
jgi:hypothetical protein